MRQTLSRGMVAAAAATGILSLCGSPALADSHADGAATNSPGAVSGNALQVPVDVPVNACGNTVDVIAALNPAFGNECENASDEQTGGHGGGYGGDTSTSDASDASDASDPAASSGSGAHADGATHGSPGVDSGNTTQVPVDVPVNLCGNTVDVIAALNPVFGNECENSAEEPPGYGEEEPPPPTTPPGYGEEEPPPPTDEEPPPPGEEEPPPPTEEEHTPPAPQTEQPPVLAETGSEGTLGAAAAGAVLIAGGAILYRRGRAAAGR
ncbi:MULTISPECIES: LAXTG-anchored chaplin ChpA [Streptomyces]|uniref:LAXTG-anchored chaplin ChpA n=1 Tax=Streptomyces TaxID=1883 RepID=UPI00224101D6|nr:MULTISPECIES: LAXTG-anchored chaplin ChpA [Streptomyces]MCX5037753.1 LAXTG-anchored chaplin ChpA [Streptomyces coelicoflavus]